MSRTRSDYAYDIDKANKVVFIEDLNRGRMSVTNDIENVIVEIANDENFEVDSMKWVYKDSDGIWDGYDPSENSFIALGVESRQEALSLILC